MMDEGERLIPAWIGADTFYMGGLLFMFGGGRRRILAPKPY